ncbi:MAG: DinB family protein [Bacteroidetes bacterium]|nr:DinB family protein [Bacteroidota bacterium]
MDYLDQLKRAFRYEFWATRVVLDAAISLDSPPARLVRVLNHLVAAQQLWLDRLHGDKQQMPVWPEEGLDQIRTRLESLEAAYAQFLDNQRTEKLMRPIAYTNSKGVPWANRVEEILTHVSLHSAYHRGQATMLLRDAGVDPPLTDFIHAVRTGSLD